MKVRARDPKQVWREEFESSRTRRTDDVETSTISGVPVKPLYTSDDLPVRAEEMPGQYPYTRGIHPCMYLAVAEKQGVPFNKLGGTLQNDILKEFIAQKEFIFPPEPSMRLVVDSIEYCAAEVPKWNTISISGYHIREAGSTAAQELAFTLADGMAYVDACIERGLRIDEFASRLSCFFDVD